MGRNRALGSPYQVATVTADFTANHAVDAYMVDAVPLIVTLDPAAANNDQVLIQDVTNDAAASPIVINVSDGQEILNGFGSSISVATDGGAVLLTMTPEGWVPQVIAGGGAASAPASAFNVCTQTVPFSVGPEAEVISMVTVTPNVTGKFVVIGTAIVAPGGGGVPATGHLSVGHGAATVPAQQDFASGSPGVTIQTVDTAATIAIQAEYGSAVLPTVFPVGTPVQLNLNLNGNSNGITVTSANDVQWRVQELLH